MISIRMNCKRYRRQKSKQRPADCPAAAEGGDKGCPAPEEEETGYFREDYSEKAGEGDETEKKKENYPHPNHLQSF